MLMLNNPTGHSVPEHSSSIRVHTWLEKQKKKKKKNTYKQDISFKTGT